MWNLHTMFYGTMAICGKTYFIIVSRSARALRGFKYWQIDNSNNHSNVYYNTWQYRFTRLSDRQLTVSTVRGPRDFIVRADRISVRWSWTGEPRCPLRIHWSRPVQFTWSGHAYVACLHLQGRRPVQEASDTDPSVTISYISSDVILYGRFLTYRIRLTSGGNRTYFQ